MINIYFKLTDENIIRQMYNLIKDNLSNMYPELSKTFNNDKYIKWVNTITSDKNYKVITYSINAEILGFLSYTLVNEKLWISEVQVKKDHKNRGILKQMLREFTNNNKEYKEVTIHINTNNELSTKIFKHIGFKSIGNTLYKIDMIDLTKYCHNY